jgi:hypothetical protein
VPEADAAAPAAAPASTPDATPAPPPAPEPVAAAPSAAAGELSLAAIEEVWVDKVLKATETKVRMVWRAGRPTALRDGRLTVTVPNQPHAERCEAGRADVVSALRRTLGAELEIDLVAERATEADTPRAPVTEVEQIAEIEAEAASVDLEELTDAPATAGEDLAVSKVMDAFGGAVREANEPG